MKLRMLPLVLFAVLATSGVAMAKDRFSIFGVTVKGDTPILTKKLVQAASDAASAFGIQKQHSIEAIDGLVLSRQFDKNALTPSEREYWERVSFRPTEKTYILVKGVFGGGCIAVPVWNLSAPGERALPIGVTRMRCAMTEDGFARLIKVAAVAINQ